MGREQQTQPPVEPEFIRQCFAIRQDGQLIWRERPPSHFPARVDDTARFNNQRAGEPAGFRGPNGKPLVRFTYGGKTRRVALLKAAWIVATGELPRGPILPRDGDQWNASFENLIEVRHGGRDPFGALTGKHSRGGKASALAERQTRNTRLIEALAANLGSTVPQLSRLIGSSSPCTCVRLSKLADAGLCIGPRCNARARWDLSQKGRELAARTIVVLDDLDHDILRIIARSQTKLMKIVAQTGVCRLTARRRVNLMVERKLIESHGRRFSTTDAGLAALGPDAPKRWIDLDRLRASNARDVQARNGHQPDDRTAAQRSAHAAKAVAAMRGRPRGGKAGLAAAIAYSLTG